MLENLQVLRAFAALAVVLYHVLYTSVDYGQSPAALLALRRWGKDGVDVFFVISGFVMVHAQSQRPRAPWEFLRQRIIRIVPLYWLLTILLGALPLLLPGISRAAATSPGRFAASLLFLSCIVYRDLPVIFVGWSLEYEMFFYCLFAVAIGLRRRISAFWFIGGTLLLLASLSIVKWVALEFLFGMLCAQVFGNARVSRYAPFCAAVGLSLLLAPLVFPFGGPELLVSGLPAAFLVLGAAGMPQVRAPRWNFLGAASYSIYLVQVFAIPAFYKVSARYLSAVPGDALAVLAVLATVLAGYALHVFVEKPLTLAAKRRRVATEAKAVAAATV